ncbi:LacI family DNA-binding transcriptional regulator [Pseudoclavibacter terrae]|uniref:LacI family transcriptional regulator n=1 Tax=Pseudoclavibacter terrae TaxID=1530195 RepID=A0A7J5B8D8_9MICO|nr:LacI family DNA-binding transcriptional regulator [Pseudoclavibacter terrae]KAB1639901.1 LacI family transcriptional regulator [Pseudoclavibacter terrae]
MSDTAKESNRTKPATRADVARLAGVSPSVVSFALNKGSGRVAEDTARRVREAAALLGYVPNAAARALRRGTSDAIGLLIHDIRNPFYNQIAAEVQQACDRHGRNLIVATPLGQGARFVPLLMQLDASKLAGIIVTVHLSAETIDRLLAAGFSTPVVQLNSNEPLPGAVGLRPGYPGAIDAAFDHLAELGHESIAFVGPRTPRALQIQRWEAYHRERGVPRGSYAEVEPTRAGGHDGMRQVLTEGTPTAVFAGTGLIAVGVMLALQEAGLRVPDDISVLSYDDIPDIQFMLPPLTSIRIPVEEMARDAVDALISRSPLAEEQRQYTSALIVRGSTSAPNPDRLRR